MHSFCDRFKNIEAKDSFFIGANTPSGFTGDLCHYVTEDNAKRSYILKGCPGCGKSTLMKKISASAENCGAHCTYLYCSSDPDSLDGIIMEKGAIRVAVTDGTSPHSDDPVYVGAVGRIVDLGAFLDNASAEKCKNDIVALAKEKKSAYKISYRYLSAAGEITKTANRYAAAASRDEKMMSYIERLGAEIKRMCRNKSGGEMIYRRTLAVSMKGCVRLMSFENGSSCIAIKDTDGMAFLFYEKLLSALRNNGIGAEVSLIPTGGVAEIHIPEAELSLAPYREGADYIKTVNLNRFTDRGKASELRVRRRFSEKCYGAVMDEAEMCLGDARRYHFEIEDIYKKCIDYSGIDTLTEKLTYEIVSLLCSN